MLVLYTHLWVLEGAIRKWVGPLDDIFYVARDGLLVGALIVAAIIYPTRSGRTIGVVFWGSVGALLILVYVQTLNGNPLLIGLFGMRNYIAPLIPLYVALRYLDHRIQDRIVSAVLFYIPLQAAVSLLQVLSPANSVINFQVGSEEAYFTTANGIVRASGTFSSPIGLTLFLTLAFAFVLARMSDGRARAPIVACAGLVVLNAFLSGSRGTLLACAIVLAVYAMRSAALGSFRSTIRSAGVIVLIAVVGLVGSVIAGDVFQAFATRISTASDSDNVGGRLLGNMFSFVDVPLSFFGNGAGAHSAIGVALGSNFGWIEDDSARWSAELGLVGTLAALLRLVGAAFLAVLAIASLTSWTATRVLALAALLPVIAYGSMTGQPTTQGFVAITAIVACLASQTKELTR